MQYKMILQFVQQIISSVNNAAIMLGREIRQASEKTISVNVTNPQERVEVTGTVSVANQKDTDNQLKNIALAVRELMKPIKNNKEVSVSNFPKYPEFPKLPEHPKTISVSNFPKGTKLENMDDLLRAITKVLDAINGLKLDPKIEVKAPVVNVEKADAPIVNVKAPIVNVEKPDLSSIKEIMEFLEAISSSKPLAVRLSDGKKFYKALERMGEIYTGTNFSSFMSSSGGEARAILNQNNELRVTTTETWSLNNTHTVGNITYLGEETVDGLWRITQVEKVGNQNVMHYATKRNNPSTVAYEYPAAWDEHLTLDYGRVSEAL